MKLVLTFILFFISYSAYSQYSFRSSAVSTYTPISTTAGDPVRLYDDDDGGATLSLPFTFTFNGTDYNSFGVSTNGYIAFDDIDYNDLYASSITYDENNDFYLKTGIAILLQDLKQNSGEIYYKHIDVGTVNERVIIEWYNWGEYVDDEDDLSGQFSMQMSLYKNGKITFLYDHPTNILNNTQFGIGLIFNNLSTGDDLFGVNRLSSNASSSSSNYGSTINTTIVPTIIPSVSGQYLFYEFYTYEPPTFEPPTFANPGPITMCELGSYYLAPSTTDGSWTTSTPTVATVNSNGYVTALSQGTTVVSLTTIGGTVTASINVVIASSYVGAEPAITDGQASYKIKNTSPLPQGPTADLFMGYSGFNYSSSTKPTKPGFYRANNVDFANKTAGCPYPFQIFRCTTCPDPVGPR